MDGDGDGDSDGDGDGDGVTHQHGKVACQPCQPLDRNVLVHSLLDRLPHLLSQ